jgi:hypothetical protein
MPEPELPDKVRDVVDRHLEAVDAVRPGLIQALYLTGSIALGDYQPGRSDVDFTAFTSRPVGADDVAALREVHAGLDADMCYDGNYVCWQSLPDVPLDGRPGPHIVEGEFRTDGDDELTPSTWAEFARYAIAMRGPAAASLGVRVPRSRLAEWNLGNLNGYWRNLAHSIGRIAAERDPAGLVRPDTVAWCILGPPRLHYTLATGDITSWQLNAWTSAAVSTWSMRSPTGGSSGFPEARRNTSHLTGVRRGFTVTWSSRLISLNPACSASATRSPGVVRGP